MSLSASLTFSPVGENVIDSTRVEPLLAHDNKRDLLHWHGPSAFRRSPRRPISLHPLTDRFSLRGGHLNDPPGSSLHLPDTLPTLIVPPDPAQRSDGIADLGELRFDQGLLLGKGGQEAVKASVSGHG